MNHESGNGLDRWLGSKVFHGVTIKLPVRIVVPADVLIAVVERHLTAMLILMVVSSSDPLSCGPLYCSKHGRRFPKVREREYPNRSHSLWVT